MKVVERKPVPYYESTCPECHSIFRYKASETSNLHVDCPVCGTFMWASRCPAGYEEVGTYVDE